MKYALISLVFLLAACSQAPTTDVSNDPVTLGMFGGFTGLLAPIGQQELIAAEYAQEQVNKNGGVNGRPLQIVFEDSKCNPKEAVTAITKLADTTEARIILGGLCTGETVSAAPVANERHIVLLSALSSGPQIKDAGDYVFRTNPRDDGSSFADYILAQKYKKVAIISEQTDFAQGVKKILLPQLDAAGVTYTTQDVATDTTDFRTALLKLQQTNPDLLLINSNSFAFGLRIYNQAKPLDFAEIMGSRGWETGTLGELGTAEGVIFYGSIGIVDESQPDIQEMQRRYQARYNATPISSFAYASQYDDIMLAVDAMKACGATNSTCIKEYLYSTKDYTGLIGTYSFDSDGEVVGVHYKTVTVENGLPVALR
jgi:branched-chain amino acid transport system substrate-binding protein